MQGEEASQPKKKEKTQKKTHKKHTKKKKTTKKKKRKELLVFVLLPQQCPSCTKQAREAAAPGLASSGEDGAGRSRVLGCSWAGLPSCLAAGCGRIGPAPIPKAAARSLQGRQLREAVGEGPVCCRAAGSWAEQAAFPNVAKGNQGFPAAWYCPSWFPKSC